MRYTIVDAFTSSKFGGNPAAVCVLEQSYSDELLQALAAEFNLSETAYLSKRTEGEWDLRWFTPLREVNLCGHATLASAHALWSQGLENSDNIRFHSRSGCLLVSRNDGRICMDFPRTETLEQPHVSEAVQNAVAGFVSVADAGEDILVELPNAEAVAGFVPDFAALAAIPVRGVIITAAGDDCDIVSRFFAPRFGINEDPVTGSAHCALADYWARRLGKAEFSARQLSPRGGELSVALRDQRVLLFGQAVTTMAGEVLAIPHR